MSSPSPETPSEPSSSAKLSWWGVIRAALAGKPYDYTSGKLSLSVILLAIPMVLETAMESLFSICDIFWVSKLGKEATAAVGLTESVTSLYYAIGIGLSMAATATIARRIGEKRPEDAARAGAQAIYVGVVFGVITGILCWIYAPNILRMMKASDSVVEIGVNYTRYILGGNVVILLLFLNNAIFRGAGDAALAMRALWLGNGINIILDPCLIFGWGPFPEMGLEGAGLATLIGRGTAVFYQFYHLSRGTGQIRLTQQTRQLDFPAMLKLVRVSIGGIGQMLVATTSWVALMRMMAHFEEEALAGYTIAIRIIIFTLLPSWGLANAAATLVGQNLGAKNPSRAEKSVWLTGAFNMGFLLVVMAVYLTLGERFVGFFVVNEPEVLRIGVRCLQLFTYGYLFFGWGMVLTQAFNGAGDTMTPTWLSLIAFWVIQIPLAWLFAIQFGWGPSGILYAVLTADVVFVILALILFLRGSWKQREV